MLYNISNKINEALTKLKSSNKKVVSNALSELENHLIDSDVSQTAASKFITDVKEKYSTNPNWLECLHDALIDLISAPNPELNLKVKKPAVIMMVGAQGAGKTTFTAKLAVAQSKKLKVLACSVDIYRPAAMEQLQKMLASHNVNVVVSEHPNETPLEIALRARQKASKENYDMLIIDTAGRQHEQENLMQEVCELHKNLNPIETLLVLDGMSGNFAIDCAKNFKSKMPISGFVLTKMDGDQKGGAAISIVNECGLPIKFIGRGEQIDKIEIFNPERFAKIILDLGDQESFIENLKKIDDLAKPKVNPLKQQFDFNTYLEWLEKLNQLGGLEGFIGMMPGSNKIMQDPSKLKETEEKIKATKTLISSMTKKERANPQLLQNNSRRRRIIKGAGSDVRNFNQMMKQFKQIQKTMSSLKGGKMAKLLAQLKSNPNLNL